MRGAYAMTGNRWLLASACMVGVFLLLKLQVEASASTF